MRDETPTKVEIESKPELVIKPQTLEEELDRIQGTLIKMDWFKQHGYTPKLPDNPELATPFPDNEKAEKLALLSTDYKPEIYEAGKKLLEASRSQIEAVFPTFAELHEAWEFKVFPEYQIVLTRYGMGGSYNADTGKVIMRVNDNGTFSRAHPHHTPIHEMVHMGVEDEIVKRFNLTQAEKERMVDLMISILFAESLPDYKIQSIGDTRIVPFVTAETMSNLPEAIHQYVTTYPRETTK